MKPLRFAALLIPALFSLIWLSWKANALKALEAEIESMSQEHIAVMAQKEKNAACLKYFSQTSFVIEQLKNQFKLHEEKRRTAQEVEEIELIASPVEMNEIELAKTVALIEENGILIPEFDLTKARTPSDEEVYRIDLKLLKRESLP